MIKFLFEQNYNSKATKRQNCYFRGHLWYEKKYYEGNIDEILNICGSLEKLQKIICKFNGNYILVCKAGKKIIAVVDRIMSFPLLYTIKNGDIYLSDSLEVLRKNLDINELDLEAAKCFLSSGFTLDDRTVFEKIKIVLPGHYLIIEDETNEIIDEAYFEHHHADLYTYDIEKMAQLLDETINNVFERLVYELRGRQVALFLSGGYDSRLVAVMLKKFHYENVICFSFGSRKSKEETVAKEIAEDLGYRWILIDAYKIFRKINNESKGYDKFLQEFGLGVAYPYEQGALLKPYLLDGTLEKDCVVITGNTGDVVEGADFSRELTGKKNYGKEEIIEAIVTTHCCKYGFKYGHDKDIVDLVSNFIPDNDYYTYEEAQDHFERFNWLNRQCKYVVNDIRCYDLFLGVDWRLPLWDNEFVDFWLRVPIELREYRKLYYYYVKDEKYNTANIETGYDKIRERIRKKAHWFLRMAYPVRKIYEYMNILQTTNGLIIKLILLLI